MTPSIRFAGMALLVAAAGIASAQQVYRNVDKNGKVTYSDQPPAAASEPTRSRAGVSTASGAGLPYELRQVVQRYPVTLYSREDCAPCADGRSMLISRGIPFDERIVATEVDSEALRRLSGQISLPLLTIGAQQLKGYSDSEWSQYLDAAGYPKSNQLPPGFARAPARPLVAIQQAPVEQPNVAPVAPPSRPALVDGPTPSNPAGIKF